MSQSPERPQTTSRGGRIIKATKRKLQAPIDTFVKIVKKPRPARTELETTTASLAVPTPPSIPTSPVPASSATAAVPSTRRGRYRGAIVVEDSDDESSNGDVLPPDSRFLMEDAQSSTSAKTPVESKAPSVISIDDDKESDEGAFMNRVFALS